MDVNRGTRSTECRMLPDKTPCPGYTTEWSVAYHGDMMNGGALNISQERLEYLQKLKKVTIKYFAHKYNILSDQEQFTRAVHRYQLHLGEMKAGDYLCINQDHHEKVKSFDSEPLMREHWLLCHGIKADEILLPMVVPDMLKEPGKPMKEQGPGGKSGTPVPSGPPVGAPGAEGDVRQVTGPEPDPSKRASNISAAKQKELSKAFNKSEFSKANFRGMSYKSKETPAEPNPDSMDTESQGKPEQPVVKYTGGKLSEYEPDPDFEEGVSTDLAKEIEELEKK